MTARCSHSSSFSPRSKNWPRSSGAIAREALATARSRTVWARRSSSGSLTPAISEPNGPPTPNASPRSAPPAQPAPAPQPARSSTAPAPPAGLIDRDTDATCILTGRLMHEYDKSSKWLIQHHGDSILRMAGIVGIETWRPLQAEVVHPRQLPDGLIEVLLQGQFEPSLFVLELATYPESRIAEQVLRDMTLVYLDRRVVPDVITLVLHPRGNLQVTGSLEMMSPGGMTQWSVRWKVVQLWSIPAETLLDAHDVGLVPWVPLTHFDGPPEPIFQQCRARIDEEAPPEERENLLAVTQVLAGLRYNEVGLFQLLGGRDAMIESPVLQELKAEWTREAARETKRRTIVDFLVARFGPQAEEIATHLETIADDARLKELVKLAAVCSDLPSFRKEFAG